jgi:hypothetical protein
LRQTFPPGGLFAVSAVIDEGLVLGIRDRVTRDEERWEFPRFLFFAEQEETLGDLDPVDVRQAALIQANAFARIAKAGEFVADRQATRWRSRGISDLR